MIRIGVRMRMVREYAHRFPGCVKYQIARQIGPYGSIMYGYRAIERAERAGLVVDRSTSYPSSSIWCTCPTCELRFRGTEADRLA